MRNVRLFLCGDLMTGRGIDQIMRRPVAPAIHEGCVRSALGYVELAERAHGPIPRGAGPAYVWGEALDALATAAPEARIVNLETAVTRSEDWEPKGINYRMSPDHVDVLTAARIDCCVLANNHVLDWGRVGLDDTLATLADAGIRAAGAGPDAATAAEPAAIPLDDGGRILVFAWGHASSGIPRHWAAGADRPGVNLLPDLGANRVQAIADGIRARRGPGDVVVASIHWGGNWGYEVAAAHRAFARGLVRDAGVDVVHGHSSHHPRGIELCAGRPILYGCGDFINDYEGIGAHGELRDDLAVMYLAEIDRDTRGPARLVLEPFRIRRFRLERASPADRAWLRDELDRESARLGAGVTDATAGRLAVSPR